MTVGQDGEVCLEGGGKDDDSLRCEGRTVRPLM